jgi:hypothetical protein
MRTLRQRPRWMAGSSTVHHRSHVRPERGAHCAAPAPARLPDHQIRRLVVTVHGVTEDAEDARRPPTTIVRHSSASLAIASASRSPLEPLPACSMAWFSSWSTRGLAVFKYGATRASASADRA